MRCGSGLASRDLVMPTATETGGNVTLNLLTCAIAKMKTWSLPSAKEFQNLDDEVQREISRQVVPAFAPSWMPWSTQSARLWSADDSLHAQSTCSRWALWGQNLCPPVSFQASTKLGETFAHSYEKLHNQK